VGLYPQDSRGGIYPQDSRGGIYPQDSRGGGVNNPITPLMAATGIPTVQTSNMQNAFGVQVYGEVLYLEFYSVYSEPFLFYEILLCKSLQWYVL
jgi:hypothetical protein